MVNLDTRDPLLDTSGENATFYEREFFTFSNFSSFAVEWPTSASPFQEWWPTTLFQTSEHAFQAARFMLSAPDLAEEVIAARSAHAAWQIKNENRDRQHPEWTVETDGTTLAERVMLDICRHKLIQHPYVQKQLRRTGDALIIEDSPVDSFWGWGPNRIGRNALGKVWMQLRKELISGKIESL